MTETFLEYEERRDLRKLVAGLYAFTDLGGRGRREFIQNAGLGRFVPGMDLSGPADTVAGDLIGRLEKYGKLDERPAYHALGALLEALLDVGELPPQDRSFIARLIVVYTLVADQAYIDRLRQKYDLTDEVVRKPEGQYIPPPRAPGIAPAGPQFKPEILDTPALETIINSEDNFLDIYLLYGALYCSHAVCRLEDPKERPVGTGFLVNKNILLTNQHVIPDKYHLENAVARFNYQVDANGVPGESTVVRFDPDFYYPSPPEKLDYALLRLEREPLADLSSEGDLQGRDIQELVLQGKHRGYLTLSPEMILDRYRINIIQHPDGNPKKVVMTQNYVVGDMTATRVQYVADTMNGSSGSPVFNQKWQVVALHHSGSPYPPEPVVSTAKKAWKGALRVNEAIPMRAILADLHHQGLDRFLPRD